MLVKYGFVYLSMQVRTGKTLTAMGTAQKLGVDNMLFVTKKKAISSIEDDYKKLKPKFHINVVNYESLHKVCLLYTSPSPRDRQKSRMPSSA